MNITNEGYEMGTILDAARDMETAWEAEYRLLKAKEKLTDQETERFIKLGVRLGYRSGVNTEIECEGCGA